jgi:DNA polymerase/3'-5' exonuclease PolX
MSSGKRYHPEYAGVHAEAFIHDLGRYCERIEVAGSLRRKTADVGDVEIVCIPKLVYPQEVLLGIEVNTGPRITPLYDAIRRVEWLEPRRIDFGERMGDRYMALRDRYTEIPIDVFCVLPPAQWGVIMAIRTGPAEFSKQLMIIAKRRGYRCEDGELKDVRRKFGAPVQTPEERDFFKTIGVAWKEPEAR